MNCFASEAVEGILCQNELQQGLGFGSRLFHPSLGWNAAEIKQKSPRHPRLSSVRGKLPRSFEVCDKRLPRTNAGLFWM